MVGDAQIDLNKTYKVVTTNFVTTGGDGYSMLKAIPPRDPNVINADAVREYIVNAGKVGKEVEGRLTIIE